MLQSTARHAFSLHPHQEKTQCKCMEVPHRITSTLSPALDLSTWISVLDPRFAVAPVTLVNYPRWVILMAESWVTQHNPKLLSVHPEREALQGFSSMNKLTDLNEVMEKTEDLNSHLFSLQIHWLHTASCVCSQFQDSWSLLAAIQGQPWTPDDFRGHLLQSTGHSKGLSEDIPSFPCMILIPTPCPELQPCRKHQAFWQHSCGTSQLPALVPLSSVCF